MFFREYFLSVHIHNSKEHLLAFIFTWELSEEHTFPSWLLHPTLSSDGKCQKINNGLKVGEWQFATSQISPDILAMVLATHQSSFLPKTAANYFQGHYVTNGTQEK